MKKLLRQNLFKYSQNVARNTDMNIGFIGLGNMGGFMAENLVKKGYNVNGFDIFKQNLDRAQTKGINPSDSLQYVAKNSDLIITMLPNNNNVSEVCNSFIFKESKKGTIIIDSSTIKPSDAIQLSKQAELEGLQFVDAPVSGGVNGAQQGTLTFMLGSQDQKILDVVEPVLKSMGKNIFQCGQIGSGQVAKMCNNLALAIQMVSISESTSLGQNWGIDPKVLQKIMAVSTSRCWSVDTYHPTPGVLEGVPASRDYENGFACKLMLKDLKIALDSAQESNTDIELGSHVVQIYENLIKQGYGDKDFGVVYQSIHKQ